MRFSVLVSTLEVASPRIRIFGFARNARAMDKSCLWPWDVDDESGDHAGGDNKIQVAYIAVGKLQDALIHDNAHEMGLHKIHERLASHEQGSQKGEKPVFFRYLSMYIPPVFGTVIYIFKP